MQISCPHCSQDYEVPDEYLGETVTCENCGKDFTVTDGTQTVEESPQTPPVGYHEPSRRVPILTPLPARETVPCPYCGEQIRPNARKCRFCNEFLDAEMRTKHEARKTRASNNPVYWVISLVKWFTGLSRLDGFRLRNLFKNTFKRHSKEERDALFCSGGITNTPDIGEVPTAWPQPWMCWRLMLIGIVCIGLFVFGFEFSDRNTNLLPGIMIFSAFVMPLVILLFFHELNLLRNLAFFKVMQFTAIGGIVSIILTAFVFETAVGKYLTESLDAMSAGLIEEPIKLLTVVLLILMIPGRKWTLQGMLVGAAVGAGFAGIETAGYIFNSFIMEFTKTIAYCIDKRLYYTNPFDLVNMKGFYFVMILRGVFAPFCHVIWTALAAGAVYGEIGGRRFGLGVLFKWRVLRVFIFVVILHMIWNSGLLEFDKLLEGNFKDVGAVQIFCLLVSFIGSWQVVLMMIQKGIDEIKAAQAGEYDPQADDTDQ